MPRLGDDYLAIIRCPRCGGEFDPIEDALDCKACGSAFPVVDGIPVLLPDLDAVGAQMKEW
jgi:uncharacterized protein YbaR (Trm112 family)